MANIADIFEAIERGDARASESLLPLVYDDLRKLAAHRLAQENPGQTLQATALVHEAYVRLVGAGPRPSWDSLSHFFAAAAEAMRRILVEKARRKSRIKHGGGFKRVDLEAASSLADEQSEELIALDGALEKLELEDPSKAQLVKLRYFGGLTMPEIAAMMRVSVATAERHWTYARTWLYAELAEEPSSQ